MTADVRIRRCTLEICRRDGWSWGERVDPHVESAVGRIEEVLVAAIADAGVDPGAEIHLVKPVRLEIGRDGTPSAGAIDALVEQLRAAERAAASRDPRGKAGADGLDGPGDRSTDVAQLGGASPGEPWSRALARTLARWSRSGQLERVVGGWPADVVERWIAAAGEAAEESDEGGDADTSTPQMTGDAVERIAAAVLDERPRAAGRRDAADDLLVLLGALAATLGERIPDRQTQALARLRVLGDSSSTAAGRSEREADLPSPAADRLAGERPADHNLPRGAPPDPSPAATAAAGWDTGREASTTLRRRVELVMPALPLLVLAQLSLIGYVDAISATAGAARLPRAAGALAGGLACKVLPAAWRDASAAETQDAVVAVASGGAVESRAECSAVLAAHEHTLVAPLAGALTAAYAEGWTATAPLLVTCGPEGIVCGEEDGLFPAAWVEDETELAGVRGALGGPPLRRGDGFGRLARTLCERRSVPGAPALERHLGAAAGTGLGLIARTLWGEDGRETSPLLALERLGDLEALVRCEPDGVIAAIPRGQRWLDLQRGGLLELFTIPWLPGARLEIGTW